MKKSIVAFSLFFCLGTQLHAQVSDSTSRMHGSNNGSNSTYHNQDSTRSNRMHNTKRGTHSGQNSADSSHGMNAYEYRRNNSSSTPSTQPQ